MFSTLYNDSHIYTVGFPTLTQHLSVLQSLESFSCERSRPLAFYAHSEHHETLISFSASDESKCQRQTWTLPQGPKIKKKKVLSLPVQVCLSCSVPSVLFTEIVGLEAEKPERNKKCCVTNGCKLLNCSQNCLWEEAVRETSSSFTSRLPVWLLPVSLWKEKCFVIKIYQIFIIFFYRDVSSGWW